MRKRRATWSEQVQLCCGEGDDDDGYNWRKYGQKGILWAIHPRWSEMVYTNAQTKLSLKLRMMRKRLQRMKEVKKNNSFKPLSNHSRKGSKDFIAHPQLSTVSEEKSGNFLASMFQFLRYISKCGKLATRTTAKKCQKPSSPATSQRTMLQIK